MKRFSVNEQGVGTYALAEGMTHSVDLEKAFGWSQLGELTRKAVAFAIGHVLRNATAGKMDDKAKAEGYKDANSAIDERIKALAEGKWTAHRETGEAGESRNSLLSQALAVVMGVEPAQAAEFIANEVRNALEEQGIDPDAENDDLSAEEKSKKRKIAAAVRKNISEDAGVSVELQRIKLANAQAALAEKAKAAEGKQSAFAKA